MLTPKADFLVLTPYTFPAELGIWDGRARGAHALKNTHIKRELNKTTMNTEQHNQKETQPRELETILVNTKKSRLLKALLD